MGKNLLVGQSGGPTAAINASLGGVVSYGLKSSKIDKVIGAVNGVTGIIDENFVSLDKFQNRDLLNLLKQTPSSYLGSCRYKLPDDDEGVYKKIFDVFSKYEIGSFVYIGGNDSMDTVAKLSKYAKRKNIDVTIVGVPKTIDNDLVLTDHTPGFGSAGKFIANAVRQLAMDTSVYDMKSIIVLEVMGRNAGWLTASASLANCEKIHPVDIVCLPEVSFKFDKFINNVSDVMSKKDMTIIAVSEGVKNEMGEYLTTSNTISSKKDGFSHVALGGVSQIIEREIVRQLGIKTRSIDFSTLQRCAASAASLCDIEESFNQGKFGAECAENELTGVMVGIVREDSLIYRTKSVTFDVSKVANKEKAVPCDMIDSDGMNVTDSFLNYARPLIKGEPNVIYKDGLIDFVVR